MNIFWLDEDLEKCAQYHCDKHVVKMIIEYTQLLSSCSRQMGVPQGYKLSHKNHPDTLWLLECGENWHALQSLTFWLHEEYKLRYGKIHKSYLICEKLINPHGGSYSSGSLNITTPPLCMPKEYKGKDVITSYRNYYIGEKARFASWKERPTPSWFNWENKLIINEDRVKNTESILKNKYIWRFRN